MKKLLFLCLTVFLVMTMSVSVFATGFVGSPSGSSTPNLDGFEHEDENCKADVAVVGPNELDKLDDETRKQFEDAYDKLKNDPDSNASDVFAVVFSGCHDHDGHGQTTVTLSDEALANFGNLLQYVDGEWQTVKAAKYTIRGNKLTIYLGSTGVFAIEMRGGSTSPETDSLASDGVSPVWYVLMGTSLAGLAVVAVLYARLRSKANG